MHFIAACALFTWASGQFGSKNDKNDWFNPFHPNSLKYLLITLYLHRLFNVQAKQQWVQSGQKLCSFHPSAYSLPNRYAFWIEAVQAMNIDAKVVRCDAFAMKWINSAYFAEKVARCLRMELVLSQWVLSRE
jgi:hypothetical protein